MIFYFSSTGNSKYVADYLARQTGERLIDVSKAGLKQEWKYTLDKDERLGFVFPIYAWGPPSLVLKAIKRLDIEGGERAYCYMVCTCGDDTGCTTALFRRALKAKGWKLSCGFSLAMPNTYVCLPGFDVDSAEMAQAKVDATRKRLPEVCRILQAKTENHFEVNPGKMPRLKSYVLRPLFNRFLVSDRPFHSNEACNGCSLCQKLCPVENIRMSEGHPQWQGRCIGCLRCYHRCPQHAIEYGNQTRKKGQYFYRRTSERSI